MLLFRCVLLAAVGVARARVRGSRWQGADLPGADTTFPWRHGTA